MAPPTIDLSDPEAVKRELLDEDAVVRAEFAAHLDDELTELADAFAVCFRLLSMRVSCAYSASKGSRTSPPKNDKFFMISPAWRHATLLILSLTACGQVHTSVPVDVR
ncbi:hypothetical protein [Caballeronia sp. KNU42]